MRDLVRLLLTARAVVGVRGHHARRPRAAGRVGAALWRLSIGRPRHAGGRLLDGSSTEGKSKLRRSLSGGYCASAGGHVRRDAGACRSVADEAVARRGGRWNATPAGVGHVNVHEIERG